MLCEICTHVHFLVVGFGCNLLPQFVFMIIQIGLSVIFILTHLMV